MTGSSRGSGARRGTPPGRRRRRNPPRPPAAPVGPREAGRQARIRARPSCSPKATKWTNPECRSPRLDGGPHVRIVLDVPDLVQEQVRARSAGRSVRRNRRRARRSPWAGPEPAGRHVAVEAGLDVAADLLAVSQEALPAPRRVGRRDVARGGRGRARRHGHGRHGGRDRDILDRGVGEELGRDVHALKLQSRISRLYNLRCDKSHMQPNWRAVRAPGPSRSRQS